MSDYQKASKIVKPKMLALQIASAQLDEANENLGKVQLQLEEVQALQAKLNS